jgi:aspartyl-tRNA(Asn)/glutamyl-tRNA(Gln) amidotransferase subunit C
MLSKDEVKHIASLARLRFTDDELETFRKELGSILDFVGKLNEVDTVGVQPTAQVTGIENAVREDAPPEGYGAHDKDLLAGQAPQKDAGCIKVKAVFE